MINEDFKNEMELLNMKISALSHHAYEHLESVEYSLGTRWCNENKLAFEYMKEVRESLYISTTLISNIQTDIERLNEKINKEKVDNIRPDQEKMLPTAVE